MQFGDVVLVDLPRPVGAAGSEQFGQRPAIVFHSVGARANLSTLVIVPLTSQQSGLRFQGSFLVYPSRENGLTEESVVLSHQIRAIDKKRIRKVIGHLEKDDLNRLKDELRAILNL
jgi:mRNA interferase MazF